MHEPSPPSEHGVDAAGIDAFLDAIEHDERIEPHGLIVQHGGQRIAEGYWAPHDRGRGRLVYSLSKSFTGAALGLQISEGRLSLDDLVSDHLPELFHDAHSDATRLRIRHIASMATGHSEETFGAALAADPNDVVRGFLSLPAQEAPGTVFAYNQPPVLALAMILERLAGQRLSEYLAPRLLNPLGVTTFEWARWPPGIDMGFSGVFTDLDAIARLGQLHLDLGRIAETSILPEAWVTAASSAQTKNPGGDTVDWQQGYGFQLWRSQHGYRGDGAFGQFMVVLPAHDSVIAMFSNTDHMQLVLDAMWEHLLPAFDRQGSAAADDALAARLETLRLPTAGERLSTTGRSLDSGGLDRSTAVFAPAPPSATSQPSITSVALRADRIVINENDAMLDLPLTAAWSTEGSIATSAARHLDDTITVDVVFLNTPHRLELTLADGTFESDWGRLPLFRAGLSNQLRAIADA